MEQLLEESRTKNAKLEAEVEKVRTHAFKISEKCANLEKRIFTVLFPTMLTLNIMKENLNLAFDQGGLEL